MVSFQRLPLPVLNPGWSLQSPQGSQKILIMPQDPHPKIKVTQSKTATVHHTVKTQQEGLYSGQSRLCHTALDASQHPEGFPFFLCLSWALYSEPDAGTSKAARNNFPGTARAFYHKGHAHSPWERGTESILQGASPPPRLAQRAPHQSGSGAPGLSPQTQQMPRVGLAHVSAIPRTELFTNLRQTAQVPAAQMATVM